MLGDDKTEPAKPPPKGAWYRCQFCGVESPAANWDRGDTCPSCKRVHDPVLAQDDKE